MISVVIPYLSGFEDLKKCISSIRKQNINSEIIVVNDSRKELVLDKLKVKIINNNKTMGAAYSRNIGFEKSSSNYVLFIDHDVFLQVGSLNSLFRDIETVDFVFPKILYENNKIMHPIGKEKEFPQISACFMIKKKSVKKMDELFDENYKIYLEDADFFLRTNIFGLKSKYVNKAIGIHKLKKEFNEKRFYLETKNLYYGWLKFYGVKKKGILHPFKTSSFISNFACALFNFDKFDFSHYNRSLSKYQKFKLLFRKHKKLTRRNRLRLIFYIYKMEFYSLFNTKIPFRKRKMMLQK